VTNPERSCRQRELREKRFQENGVKKQGFAIQKSNREAFALETG
jgi:hypothetical protein